MDLSNCSIDYIKACNNDNIVMKSAYLMTFLYILAFLLMFLNMQIMQI